MSINKPPSQYGQARNQPAVVGPWQRIDSKEVYANPWISIHHENVLTPANTPGIYGVVHFKGTAVGVLPIDEQGNTWLVKQTRYTLECESYEIPEGGAPAGEDPEDCARRELQEEVGLIAGRLQHFMTLHLSNSISDERAEVYIATDLTQGECALDDSEDITVHKMPFQQALQWVLDGKITDAISVAAITRFALENPLN